MREAHAKEYDERLNKREKERSNKEKLSTNVCMAMGDTPTTVYECG